MCYELSDYPGPSSPHIESGSVVFRLRCLLRDRPALRTPARPTPVHNSCSFGQRSAVTFRLRPWRRLLAPNQSGVSPTTPPPPGQRLGRQAKPCGAGPTGPAVTVGLPFLLCPGTAPRAPPSGRPDTRTQPARPWCAVQGAGRGGAGRQGDALAAFPICPSRCSAPGPRNVVPSRSGARSPAQQTPPLPVPAAVSGQGAGTARQLLRPGETCESAPAGLAGVAGGGSVTPRPWARPVPAAHAPSAPPRPGPRRQPASPEGAGRAPAAADSSGERGRPVTTGARDPGDAVVSVPFVGGRLNELSARTFRAPPPDDRCGPCPAGP